MKHAAVALDYEQRIASLEAAMLTLVDMMREQQVKLDAMHGLVMELVKRELRGSYPRPPQKKPLEIKVNACKVERPERARQRSNPGLISNAVAEGRAS